MNITYLIGNGFDLAQGLKTGYESFYNYYIKQPSDIIAVNNLKQEISRDINDWSDLELKLGEYTSNFASVDDAIEVYFDINDRLREYLSQEQKRFHASNAQIEANRVDLCFPYRALEPEDARYVKSLIPDGPLAEDVNVNIVSFNYTDVLERAIGVDSLDPHTRLLVSKSGIDFKLGNIVHVHGSLEKDLIVFGVDSIAQIQNNQLSSDPAFRDVFVKPNTNRAIREAFDSDAEELINNADILIVFGMSFGKTDGLWWANVINVLSEDKTVLLHSYTGRKLAPSRKALLGSMTLAVQNKFLAASRDTYTTEFSDEVKRELMVSFDTAMFNHSNLIDL